MKTKNLIFAVLAAAVSLNAMAIPASQAWTIDLIKREIAKLEILNRPVDIEDPNYTITTNGYYEVNSAYDGAVVFRKEIPVCWSFEVEEVTGDFFGNLENVYFIWDGEAFTNDTHGAIIRQGQAVMYKGIAATAADGGYLFDNGAGSSLKVQGAMITPSAAVRHWSGAIAAYSALYPLVSFFDFKPARRFSLMDLIFPSAFADDVSVPQIFPPESGWLNEYREETPREVEIVYYDDYGDCKTKTVDITKGINIDAKEFPGCDAMAMQLIGAYLSAQDARFRIHEIEDMLGALSDNLNKEVVDINEALVKLLDICRNLKSQAQTHITSYSVPNFDSTISRIAGIEAEIITLLEEAKITRNEIASFYGFVNTNCSVLEEGNGIDINAYMFLGRQRRAKFSVRLRNDEDNALELDEKGLFVSKYGGGKRYSFGEGFIKTVVSTNAEIITLNLSASPTKYLTASGASIDLNANALITDITADVKQDITGEIAGMITAATNNIQTTEVKISNDSDPGLSLKHDGLALDVDDIAEALSFDDIWTALNGKQDKNSLCEWYLHQSGENQGFLFSALGHLIELEKRGVLTNLLNQVSN